MGHRGWGGAPICEKNLPLELPSAMTPQTVPYMYIYVNILIHMCMYIYMAPAGALPSPQSKFAPNEGESRRGAREEGGDSRAQARFCRSVLWWGTGGEGWLLWISSRILPDILWNKILWTPVGRPPSTPWYMHNITYIVVYINIHHVFMTKNKDVYVHFQQRTDSTLQSHRSRTNASPHQWNPKQNAHAFEHSEFRVLHVCGCVVYTLIVAAALIIS